MLAAAGLGSRRACEQLIADGRVSVDGAGRPQLGTRVDPATAVIQVDGERVNVRADLVYLALNKPRGVLSARCPTPRAADVATSSPSRPERLFHVGRLDADTEGLLLLTNDGDLAHRLTHPSLRGRPRPTSRRSPARCRGTSARRLRAGVLLEDGPVRRRRLPAGAAPAARGPSSRWSLHEGRKHIVRRLLAEVGHPVERLVRTAVGPVRLGGQRAGTSAGADPRRAGRAVRTYRCPGRPGPARCDEARMTACAPPIPSRLSCGAGRPR